MTSYRPGDIDEAIKRAVNELFELELIDDWWKVEIVLRRVFQPHAEPVHDFTCKGEARKEWRGR